MAHFATKKKKEPFSKLDWDFLLLKRGDAGTR